MKKPLLVILIIAGAIALLLGACVVIGVIFFLLITDLPVQESDKRLLVQPSDLLTYFEDFQPIADAEVIKKIKYLDGSVELSLEYDVDDEDQPYMVVTVTREVSRADAMMVYKLAWSASLLGLTFGDSEMDVKEDNVLISIGDRSRFGLIKYEGNNVGTIFVFMKGNSIYEFLLSGLYIDDPEILHELFDARAEDLGDFR